MKRLRRYLERQGLSQAQFAQLMGVSQPTVCAWLTGESRPSIDRLKALSDQTGIGINDLLADLLGSDQTLDGNGRNRARA
jgi:transcriptional regulator with XRE-family HTH domain